MLSTRHLKLRAFLEGQEVPVISAFVQIGPNSPATCSLQVVPADEIFDLKARTMVHVFYLEGDPKKTTGELLKDYKLLFAGEMMGYAYAKTPISRSAVLQCVDFSSYWDTTYQFFLSYGKNGNALNPNVGMWAGGAIFNNITSGHMHKLNELLQQRPKTPGLQEVSGLLGGIISLLETMGGIPNHYRGVNDFFTIAELKNLLIQQLCAHQNDATERQLFSGKAFMNWLKRGMTGMGQISTFRDMLKLLFRHIYYDVVPNPVAKYVPGAGAVWEDTTQTHRWPSTGDRQSLLAWAALCRKMQKEFSYGGVYTPNEDHAKPAREILDTLNNLLDGGTYISPRGRRHLKAAQSYSRQILSKLFETISESNRTPVPVIRDLYRRVALELLAAVRAKLTQKEEWEVLKSEATVPQLFTQIFRPECFFAPPPRCNVLFPERYTQIQYNRNFLQEPTRMWMSTGMTFVGHSIGGYFHSVTYAPSRKAIQEVAKEQGNKGLRSLMDWEIYSGILPKFESISDLSYVSKNSEKKKKLARARKGPAASYSQRAANFNFLRHRFAPRVATVSSIFTPELVCGFPALVIEQPFIPAPGELERAAKAVQKSLVEDGRQINLTEILRNIREIATEAGAPTHYLGTVAGLGHSVGQDGGVSSLTLSHVRTHQLTDDDYLIALSTEASTQSKFEVVEYRLRASSKNEKELQLLYDLTPQDFTGHDLEPPPLQSSPTLTKRKSATQAATSPPKLSSDLKVVNSFPLYALSGAIVKTVPGLIPDNGRPIAEVPRYAAKYPIGAELPSPIDGHLVKLGLGESKGLRIFSKDDLPFKTDQEEVLLYEELVVYARVEYEVERAEIPVEEAMRPPWFSPLYSNWFIGKDVYDLFFGTGSIVDPLVVRFGQVDEVAGIGVEEESKLRAEIRASDGSTAKVLAALKKYDPKRLSDVPSIEGAADAIAYLYGRVRQEGHDVNRFIQDYIGRPIATMEDIFGSADLEFKTEKGKEHEVKQGTAGFHSRAILPYDNLIGLLKDPSTGMPRLFGKGKARTISPKLDPRKGRRKAVNAYVRSLGQYGGALATGLKG